MASGFDIAKAYEKGELCGWLEGRKPGIAKEQFNLLNAAGAFQPFKIRGQTIPTAGRKMFLHWATRKVLGKDTLNYAQEIGDCVSQGAKNGGEYLTCTQIVGQAIQAAGQDGAKAVAEHIAASKIKFRPIFAPYYYGTGRVYVGGGQLGNDDGSLGSWMAEAVKRFGTLFADEAGVPKYSGAVAKAWGDPRPAPDLDKWKELGGHHLIRSTAQIRNWEDFVAAIVNGYPCATASSIGYNMGPSSDGFHRYGPTWHHQMLFMGIDETYKNDPYALLLNSWDDVHGRLKDFETGEELPVGLLRVRRRDVERHIAAGETFAYSQFDGFPEQRLDKSQFLLV